MARKQTIVQLSDEMIELLDAEAARTGESRSSLIRKAVDAYLTDARARALTRRLVEGYTAIPQGAIDEWGDLRQVGRTATRRTLKRLDAEEDAAGLRW